jgi:NAD(P)-dependent dehydrogenase (short-subunit alcohol dehydrogenase family)
VADLSRFANVETLAKAVAEKHANLDVPINNAGIFNTPKSITEDGLDVRFAVNTIAPLHQSKSGRIEQPLLCLALRSAINLLCAHCCSS